jgi:hypothetical protein
MQLCYMEIFQQKSCVSTRIFAGSFFTPRKPVVYVTELDLILIDATLFYVKTWKEFNVCVKKDPIKCEAGL